MAGKPQGKIGVITGGNRGIGPPTAQIPEERRDCIHLRSQASDLGRICGQTGTMPKAGIRGHIGPNS